MSYMVFVSASVDLNLLESDYGDYEYTEMRVTDWEPELSDINLSHLIYNVVYEKTEEDRIKVQVIVFEDTEYGRNHQTNWITQRIDDGGNEFLNLDGNYVFKYARSGEEGLMWRNDNIAIFIYFNDYNNLPDLVLNAYFNVYPSECSEDGCPDMNKSIEERVYEEYFLGYYQYTEGLFFKHNGFNVKCNDIVKYGDAGGVSYSDLNYEQFIDEMEEYLGETLYFNETELEELYIECSNESEINIEGVPLEDFLESCYGRVYPQLTGEAVNGVIDENSLRICDNINLIISENEEYFEELENADPDIINKTIDFIVQVEIEKDELKEYYCDQFGIIDVIGEDDIIERNIYGCEEEEGLEENEEEEFWLNQAFNFLKSLYNRLF
ncbi:MAG: hypothetical protein ABIA04_08520 [Pseudomonadota bacterium]